MKKDKSIQTDIEVLKGIVTDWMEAKQSRQNALAEIDPVLGGTEIVLYEIEIERDERNIKTLQRTISALKENKELHNRLEDWIYELAYYTEDEVATPKGVKKFIGKALEDKVKEIDDLREQLHNKIFAQPKLSKQRIEIVLEEMGITNIVYVEMPDGEEKQYTIKDLAEAIYNACNAQSEEKK